MRLTDYAGKIDYQTSGRGRRLTSGAARTAADDRFCRLRSGGLKRIKNHSVLTPSALSSLFVLMGETALRPELIGISVVGAKSDRRRSSNAPRRGSARIDKCVTDDSGSRLGDRQRITGFVRDCQSTHNHSSGKVAFIRLSSREGDRKSASRHALADNRTLESRSALMSRVRSRDTAPELLVRRHLHALGYRFRLHRRDLAGTPDISFSARRKAVFVHGCFWHAHDCHLGGSPKSNTEFWESKRTRNSTRDRENTLSLEAAGWEVLVVWQCETRKTGEMLSRLTAFLGPPRRTNPTTLGLEKR